MKIVSLVLILVYSLIAKEIVLKKEGEYKLISNIHLVDGVLYKKDGTYQALVEVPAGTTAKWEVNHKSGHMEWEFKKEKPRKVKFLGYPGNYGFIPQSILEKKDGGDGDPLDIIVLGPAVDRGTVQKVRILGAIKLLDKGEQDDKIIAIPLSGPFEKVDSLAELMTKFPGTIQIVRYWFEGYKAGKMHFIGYMDRERAEALVEKAHQSWSKDYNAH